MIGWFSICVRVRIQRWETDQPLIVGSECGHYGVKQSRWVQSGEISYQLFHIVGKVEDVVKFEIISVPCNDKMGIIAILSADEVEGLVYVIKK